MFAAGDNASITLADPYVVQRGDLLCDAASPPKLTSVFDADLFWLQQLPEPLLIVQIRAGRISETVAFALIP